MTIQLKRVGREFVLGALLLATVAACLPSAFSQSEQQQDDPDTAVMRRKALELYRQGKFVDAMPLLEKLSALHPNDYVVKRRINRLDSGRK